MLCKSQSFARIYNVLTRTCFILFKTKHGKVDYLRNTTVDDKSRSIGVRVILPVRYIIEVLKRLLLQALCSSLALCVM